MLKLAHIAAAALVISMPAAAQITFESAPQPQAAKPVSVKKTDRMICERQEVIGTRLGGDKVCMSWNDWQELKFRHREQFEKVQQQAQAIAMPGM